MSTQEREWWLISTETIGVIRERLEYALDVCAQEDKCGCSSPIRNAIHELDTGLHTTDRIYPYDAYMATRTHEGG